MGDVVEVLFPADPECQLTWDEAWPPEATGWITFIDPKTGPGERPHRTSIPVTRLPGGYDKKSNPHPTLGNVWEFRDEAPSVITTHPSIHAFGRWHSPNPTRWRIVDQLADELDAEGPSE